MPLFLVPHILSGIMSCQTLRVLQIAIVVFFFPYSLHALPWRHDSALLLQPSLYARLPLQYKLVPSLLQVHRASIQLSN